MRFGPYRAKYDEPRGKVTWLAQDVANAIATVLERVKKYQTGPDFDADFDDTFSPPPTDETNEQKVIRVERELAQARIARLELVQRVQMGRINKLSERLASLEEYVTSIDDVFARAMSGTDKVLTLVATRELHTRNSKGVYTIARGKLADLAGVSVSTVTNGLKKICTPKPKQGQPYLPDDCPFAKIVTHKDVIDQETGEEKMISVIEMRPWKATARETLQAAATFAVPEDLPKHGGSAAATEARKQARHPREYPDADVIVSGTCVVSGEDLGDKRVTAQEWQARKIKLIFQPTPSLPCQYVYLWAINLIFQPR